MIALLFNSFKVHNKTTIKTHKTPPTRQRPDEFLLQYATCPAAKFLLTTLLLEKCVHLFSSQNMSRHGAAKQLRRDNIQNTLMNSKCRKKGESYSVIKSAGYHVWQEKSYINIA